MRILLYLALSVLFLQPSFAQEAEVPGIGSVWESTSVYAPNTEDGSPGRTRNDFVKVERMHDGRPVFSGKVFGYEGEILEAKAGTLVYAHECKRDVPAEMLRPPSVPNQCVWHICYAPPVGETFSRSMIIFAPIFACQPQVATYVFVPDRVVRHEGLPVTIGRVTITMNGLRRGTWLSYIREGAGEVYAESDGRVTTYTRVSVPLVPYRSGRVASSD